MKDIVESLKELKGPGLFRDFTYLLAGIFFLFILNILFKPNLTAVPNLSYIGDAGRVIIFLVVAYFFARICREIGSLISGVFLFLLAADKKRRLTKFATDLRSLANAETVTIGEKNEINHMEMLHFVSRTSGLSNLHERRVIIDIQEKVFLGFSLVLFLFYSPLFIFATLALLIFTVAGDAARSKDDIETAHFLWNENKKNKKTE